MDIGTILNDPSTKQIVDEAIRVGIKKAVDALLLCGDKIPKLFQKVDIRKLEDQFEKINKIRTIANPQYDQQIRKIYFPLSLTVSSASTRASQNISVISLEDIPKESKYLFIEGLAGQGKSTLLKYIATTEIVDSYRLPIYLEFRKINLDIGIEENIINLLKEYGVNASLKDLKDILSVDKIVLMLDGFDEVVQEKRPKVIRNLESLIKDYSPSRLLITSRPNTELEYYPMFDRAKVNFLSGKDARELVEHLCFDDAKAKRINEKITKRVEGVLVTPLLVTLLLFAYNSGEDVPDTLPDFYQKLFYVLIKQHDFSKTDYARPRKTRLGDNDLQKAFSALCFLSFNESKIAFWKIDLMKYAEKSLDLCDLKTIKQDDVIDDLVNITNLILVEGIEYEFIHKSVQEYYAACFLYSRPEAIRIELYQKAQRFSFYSKWASVLDFLSYIDRYNYVKYMMLPLMNEIFLNIENKYSVNPVYIEELLDRYYISDSVESFIGDTENFLTRRYIVPLVIDLFGKMKRERFGTTYSSSRTSTTTIRNILSKVNKSIEIKELSLLCSQYESFCHKQDYDNTHKVDF